MKNLLFIILLIVTIVSFSKADNIHSEPEIVYETKLYTVYCIENYKWLKWNRMDTSPQQMFKESASARTIPVDCYR